MIGAWIDGIGIFAPGLVGWEQARAVLAGAQPYVPAPAPKLAPALLPADVRRRTTDHIRLAVEVGARGGRARPRSMPAPLWSVFSSSDSDGAITHNICEEVARETPEVSPTRFHNSVNNAPAGYWCMAVRFARALDQHLPPSMPASPPGCSRPVPRWLPSRAACCTWCTTRRCRSRSTACAR
ncbi:MAG: beta-ketoacyl synthase chain length factor [Comamonadaceae bacterium]|nr:beta-ketoacyl synthase chain length factor [Comamonadaceae bacterium]